MELELIARYERETNERYIHPTPESIKRLAQIRMDYELYDFDPEEEDYEEY